MCSRWDLLANVAINFSEAKASKSVKLNGQEFGTRIYYHLTMFKNIANMLKLGSWIYNIGTSNFIIHLNLCWKYCRNTPKFQSCHLHEVITNINSAINSRYCQVVLRSTVNNYMQVTGIATGENFVFFIYRHFVEIL